jgi:hypothetical protein
MPGTLFADLAGRARERGYRVERLVMAAKLL